MKSKNYQYPGVDVTVNYDIKRCIHAEECIKGLPRVFDPEKKPWVDPDQAEEEDVRDVVMRCPTGALKFVSHEGENEPLPASNSISVDPNGPLFLRGDILIKFPEGTVLLADTRVALCRCGASRNKPLCDGGHSRVGFRDPGRIGVAKKKAGESGTGRTLTITPAENGPLRFEGEVTIFSADHAQAVEITKGALCRCGSSSNKPFCDGTHRTIEFRS